MPVGSQQSEREMTVPVTGAQPQPGVPEQGEGYTLDPLKRTVRTGVTFFIRYGWGSAGNRLYLLMPGQGECISLLVLIQNGLLCGMAE